MLDVCVRCASSCNSECQSAFLLVAVEAGLSVYVVGGQGVRLFVVVVSCGVLDVFLLGGFLSRHVCDLC